MVHDLCWAGCRGANERDAQGVLPTTMSSAPCASATPDDIPIADHLDEVLNVGWTLAKCWGYQSDMLAITGNPVPNSGRRTAPTPGVG